MCPHHPRPRIALGQAKCEVNYAPKPTLIIAPHVGYTEVLKQQVKEFIGIFNSEKQLMRQLILKEKKKEKLL